MQGARLRITGRVQGVGYRAWAIETAARLGLRGWVRNCRNGDVEAIVAGPAQSVDALIAWAHKGPPAAKVSTVSVEPATGDFDGFEIAPTI